MKHGRTINVKHKGYRGPGATPWKCRVNGRLIRRGWTYYVRLLNRELGAVLWEGEVIG